MTIEDWIKRSVIKGLQGLMMLRLQGAPAEDTIASLANAWLAVLSAIPHTWEQTRDAPRIQRAFLILAAKVTRWPAPREFIDCLPACDPQLKLPPPTTKNIPPEVREFLDKFLKRKSA